MENFASAILAFSVVFLFMNQVFCNVNCVPICDKGSHKITCNQSQILVTDTTNLMMERNEYVFENIKRRCMGMRECNLTRICGQKNSQILLVHFVCVNESHILPQKCNLQRVKINSNFGHILSPAYPAALAIQDTCRWEWEIEPPEDSKVVVSLHDVVIPNENDNCDKALVIRGQPCDGKRDASRFCQRNNITSLTKCGRVYIDLLLSFRNQTLRFWISFNVVRRDQVVQTPTLHCTGLNLSRDQEGKLQQKEVMVSVIIVKRTLYNESVKALCKEMTTHSEEISQESNTEVLVTMLSIISGISAVLIIILIVVCVRCHLMRGNSRSDPVYSEPSASGQPYYEYISSYDTEKTRPQLVDGYFQVADAVPATHGLEKSTSPPYDEVDRFGHLRKLIQPATSKTFIKEMKSLKKGNKEDKGAKSSVGMERDSSSKGLETKEEKTLIDEQSKVTEKEAQTFSNKIKTESKVLPTSSLKDGSPLLSHSNSHTQTKGNDDENLNSEHVRKHTPGKFPLKPPRRGLVPNNYPQSGRHTASVLPKNSSTNDNCPNNLDMIKNNIKHFSETSNVNQTTNQFSEMTPSGMNIPRNAASLTKSDTQYLNERIKTLTGKHSRDVIQEQKNQNINQDKVAKKDMQSTSGIVKNGIKRFEQNNS